VYSAVIVPHDPAESFQQAVDCLRDLCRRIHGACGDIGRIRWHGVDLVRQRTRDPRDKQTPLPQHRLDYIYQEALHGLAEMPLVHVASVWAEVGAMLRTEKQAPSRAQRRSKVSQAPPEGAYGTKVAALWHLLDLLDNELPKTAETSHRLILDGSNNQQDKRIAERYALTKGAASSFLSEPTLRPATVSRFLQLADLCAFGCFQNVQSSGGAPSAHSRAGDWFRALLAGKWLPCDRLHPQFGHFAVDVVRPDGLTHEAWNACL
jgi:hypothetical protein